MAELTVAIYVPNYVPHLIEKSILSVVAQTFDSVEIIVVDDCRTNAESRGVKSTYKKLLKSLNLRYGKSIRLLSMDRSVGMSDALRSVVEDSSGQYFSVLIMGDIFFKENTLSLLLDFINSNSASDGRDLDLVQGKVVPNKKDPSVLEINQNAYDIIEKNVPENFVEDDSDRFLEKYFLEEKHSLCIEGKFFFRPVLDDALERMPRVESFMATEYLWMYFFCRCAHSFATVDGAVCVKDMDTSPDSGDLKIETPGRWSRICSSSSVFSAIYFDLMERPMRSEDFSEYIRSVMTRYAISNVRSMSRVDSSISMVAEAILCEAWGDDIVSECRAWIEKNDS